MTENVRVCVLDARKSKKRFCSYLDDNFNCTAPTYEYDYCIGFLKRLNGGFGMTERFEPIRNSIGLKDNETGKEYVYYNEEVIQLLNNQHKTIKALEKEVHLEHMRSMFSTVKSFKGDVSKRYKYDEETDTIYDTANHYGQHSMILDKKEVTMLLNEYNSMFGDVE